MSKQLAEATATVLGRFDVDDIMALNNWLSFGNVPDGCNGRERAIKAGLLKADGSPVDRESLEAALALEVGRRIDFP